MKSVLLSIKPKYCELIANGEKTIEVRKTKPKLDTPFKCYIYCTKGGLNIYSNGKQYVADSSEILKNGADEAFEETSNFRKWNGKVIGEFICSKITEFESEFWDDETYERIQTIIKDCERYFESGEYEYETVATNEDEKYKENWLCKQSCVSWEEMRKYVGTGIKEFYGWHISNLKIYDTPKELSRFKQCHKCEHYFYCKAGEYSCDGVYKLTRPPQSWCYVEEVGRYEQQ